MELSGYGLASVLQSLGTGEAVVTVMNKKGAPSPMAAWTRLRAPQGLMSSTPDAQIDATVAASPPALVQVSAAGGVLLTTAGGDWSPRLVRDEPGHRRNETGEQRSPALSSAGAWPRGLCSPFNGNMLWLGILLIETYRDKPKRARPTRMAGPGGGVRSVTDSTGAER